MRVRAGALAAALATLLAACGSHLDPETVAGVDGAGGGVETVEQGPGEAPPPDAPVEPGPAQPPGAEGPLVGGPPVAASPGSPAGTAGPAGGNGGGDNDAVGSAPRGACDGFANTTGITDDAITIGNVSDISGPIPGLFQQTRDAVAAYVAYFNQTSDICGRKLDLINYDSRTDAGADQQAYAAGCTEVFAMVGSTSAFDQGGAQQAQECGLPDIRTTSLTQERSGCTTCFGAMSTNSKQFENIVPDTIIEKYGGGQHAAMLYINAGAAAESGQNISAASTLRGMKYDYVQGIDIAEFNYAPYVQQLEDRGIESLQFIANDSTFVRLASAMEQQGYSPRVWMLDPSAYTPLFVESGGDAVEGAVVFMNFTPFEEAASSAEMQLYLAWLQQVRPGAEPGFFGVFAWSAARLFVETAVRLGGDLSRDRLIAETRKVDRWTANGLHAPQRVGSKQVGDCWRFIQLRHGEWVPIGGTKYQCHGVTTLP